MSLMLLCSEWGHLGEIKKKFFFLLAFIYNFVCNVPGKKMQASNWIALVIKLSGRLGSEPCHQSSGAERMAGSWRLTAEDIHSLRSLPWHLNSSLVNQGGFVCVCVTNLMMHSWVTWERQVGNNSLQFSLFIQKSISPSRVTCNPMLNLPSILHVMVMLMIIIIIYTHITTFI